MNLPLKKVKQLIKNMNSMSESSIAPLKPIIEMFNIAMDEKMLDYLLALGTKEYTVKELEDVYHSMSKEALAIHHKRASHVSIDLLHEDELASIMRLYFDIETIIANEHMYQVVGKKK